MMLTTQTHTIVKDLINAGLPEKQAEIMVERFVVKAELDAVEQEHYQLATKNDLATTEAALRSDIATTEAALRSEIAKVESSLRSEIAKVESSLRSEIAKVESSLKGDIKALRTSNNLIMALLVAIVTILLTPMIKGNI